MQPELTVCIPIGPAHRIDAERAVASVRAQNVPTNVLTWKDKDGKGPGYARNQLLQYVTTPFVTFLDADDELLPDFTQRTVAAHVAGKYVYTDWIFCSPDGVMERFEAPALTSGDKTVSMPSHKPWCGGTWHIVTTLLETAVVRDLGGFDESLPAMEDTDFYLKLTTSAQCGIRVPEPLVVYHLHADSRGAVFHFGPDRTRVQKQISERYFGKMGCCGDDDKPMLIVPRGERLPTDVKAQFVQAGNRKYVGRRTRRIYERVGNGNVYWVDPQDVDADPVCWRRVDTVVDPVPARVVSDPVILRDTQSMARVMLSASKPISSTTVREQQRADAAKVVIEPAPPAIAPTPDVKRLIRLGLKGLSGLANSTPLSEPIFWNPHPNYPSYFDFFRLAHLSGYEVQSGAADLTNPALTFIVATPEPIAPLLVGAKAKIIPWQLEYGGDYAHNYDGFDGEIWASDAGFAARTGARFVMLGSHPDLCDHPVDIEDRVYEYDLTMLGYLVDRRRAIQEKLSGLRWPKQDYPGHGGELRHAILARTRIMLHIHQHAEVRAVAPQRFALAAAYRMELVSERCDNEAGIPGVYRPYGHLKSAVEKVLAMKPDTDSLYEYLCIENPFRKNVEWALKG